MQINKYIEHTNLNNKATLRDIESLCNEAIKYDFAAVCVYPYYVTLAKEYNDPKTTAQRRIEIIKQRTAAGRTNKQL